MNHSSPHALYDAPGRRPRPLRALPYAGTLGERTPRDAMTRGGPACAVQALPDRPSRPSARAGPCGLAARTHGLVLPRSVAVRAGVVSATVCREHGRQEHGGELEVATGALRSWPVGYCESEEGLRRSGRRNGSRERRTPAASHVCGLKKSRGEGLCGCGGAVGRLSRWRALRTLSTVEPGPPTWS